MQECGNSPFILLLQLKWLIKIFYQMGTKKNKKSRGSKIPTAFAGLEPAWINKKWRFDESNPQKAVESEVVETSSMPCKSIVLAVIRRPHWKTCENKMELMVGIEPTMCLTTADYKSAALPFGSHQHSKNIVTLPLYWTDFKTGGICWTRTSVDGLTVRSPSLWRKIPFRFKSCCV